MTMRSTLIFFLLFAVVFCSKAQQDTSQNRLNTLKVNLVNSMLFSNSAAFSFERVTKSHQSWSAMLGVVKFPTLGDLGSNIQVKKDGNQSGFVMGGEYRFYLKKENKYLAPHGVFLGPYTNFFNFSNDRELSFTSSSTGAITQASLKSDINVLNIGVQLGYQFVINDRWTIDMIFMGPSVSRYAMKLKLDGNYDLSEEDIYENEILAGLVDRFPVIKDLLTDQSVKLNGKVSKWAPGFRYQLNVGYRFGRKMKE